MKWEEDQRYPRFNVQLPFKVALNISDVEGDLDEASPALVSYTYNISEGGLGLVVPSLPFVYRYLLHPDHTIELELELPKGPLRIKASLVHDRPIPKDEMFLGYMITGDVELDAEPESYLPAPQEGVEIAWLIGVTIKEMSDGHRYREFVDSLLEIQLIEEMNSRDSEA